MDVRPHNGLGIQSFRAIMDIRRANGLLRLQAQLRFSAFSSAGHLATCHQQPARTLVQGRIKTDVEKVNNSLRLRHLTPQRPPSAALPTVAVVRSLSSSGTRWRFRQPSAHGRPKGMYGYTL